MVFRVSSLLPHKIHFFAYIPASHSPPPPSLTKDDDDAPVSLRYYMRDSSPFQIKPKKKGEGEEDNVIPRGGMKKKKKRKFIRRVIEKIDDDGSMQ